MVSLASPRVADLPVIRKSPSQRCRQVDLLPKTRLAEREPVARRIRPVVSADVSRVAESLLAGREFVPAEGNRSALYQGVKRTMDVAGALVLLAMLAPVMATIYAVLYITTGGRPIFCQTRVGHRGRPFTMYKFRTMRHDAEQIKNQIDNEQTGPVFKNRRDPRITTIGRLLRKTSLDETPQLFNVLLGEMALVGPRPPIAREVAEYKPWQRRRLAVKPGLTCLWQVSGRCEIEFEDWVRLDIWYVTNQTLWTDLNLLLRTPISVITGRGAY